MCAIASTLLASAQEKLPTMAQLTPGNAEWLYAKSLLNTRWNEQGKFEYTLPENADKAVPAAQKGNTSADNLWKTEADGDRLYVVTTDSANLQRLEVSDPTLAYSQEAGQSDVVYGRAVHRNEFGIEGGLFWSPTGHKLAFYRMDQSMVQSYPLVQTDAREATVRWRKYPMAGMTSHQVTLGIYDPDDRSTVYLKTNEKPALNGTNEKPASDGTNGEAEALRASLNDPEHYLTCISWRPDGKQIFVAELNRKQDYMELNVYDAGTGDFVRTLFSEKADKYVEPEHPLYFLPGSNDRFVWQDERDGFDHLYLYDLASSNTDKVTSDAYLHYCGLPSRQLTSGPWLVTSLLGADPKGKALFFTATKEDPRENHLYSVQLKTLKMSKLTAEPGRHFVKISPDGKQFYDSYSNPTVPRICELVDISSRFTRGKAQTLYQAANPFKGYARPEVETGTLKSADGETDLYYRLVKPVGFDPSKKYPAIVYLYNGPHAQLVTENFEHGLPGWDAYMAGQGFVVFSIDGRGSENRGLAFEQAIWHNLGKAEAADQLKGTDYLKSLPYVDANRIGIYGWSYGGFMATYMKLNWPETFKVGVCGGPVLDWSRYEVMYGERYMGTPQDNPDGYAANCMINQAGKLKGKLLIIHDDQDDTVVPQMSMQFLKASVQAGTYPDFIMYPNHEHNVRGKDRIHLQNRIAQYFIDNL